MEPVKVKIDGRLIIVINPSCGKRLKKIFSRVCEGKEKVLRSHLTESPQTAGASL